MPPLLEHLESLLTGTGQALDLQTFKLVDQLSGRMLGLRADTTPQAARIDAHLLNRQGVARLCYCGPILHTRPDGPYASREPLQFGAEIFGHAGPEADLEVMQLALDCLRQARVPSVSMDLGDARIVQAVLHGIAIDPLHLAHLHTALALKDSSELAALAKKFPAIVREGLLSLIQLYGDSHVLVEAEKTLRPFIHHGLALSNLKWLAAQLTTQFPGTPLSFDLADLRGYAYYTGVRYTVYAPGASDALARGGRYDEVGAVFGRKRPAVGFSVDIKALIGAVQTRPLRAAIRAPWGQSTGLRQAIGALRGQGDTVVCILPGHESEVDEFHCDRELVERAGLWQVEPIFLKHTQ